MRLERNTTPHAENLRRLGAAEYLGICVSTLDKLRMRQNRSKGPRFAKVGGVVIYRRSDLDAWIEKSMLGGEGAVACEGR